MTCEGISILFIFFVVVVAVATIGKARRLIRGQRETDFDKVVNHIRNVFPGSKVRPIDRKAIILSREEAENFLASGASEWIVPRDRKND